MTDGWMARVMRLKMTVAATDQSIKLPSTNVTSSTGFHSCSCLLATRHALHTRCYSWTAIWTIRLVVWDFFSVKNVE